MNIAIHYRMNEKELASIEEIEEKAWGIYDNPNSSEEEVLFAKRTLQRLGALPR